MKLAEEKGTPKKKQRENAKRQEERKYESISGAIQS